MMYLVSFDFKVDKSKFITVEMSYGHTRVRNQWGGVGRGGMLILIWKRNLVQEVVSQNPSSTPACAASLSFILCRLSLRRRRKCERRNSCRSSEFIILRRRFRCSLLCSAPESRRFFTSKQFQSHKSHSTSRYHR